MIDAKKILELNSNTLSNKLRLVAFMGDLKKSYYIIPTSCVKNQGVPVFHNPQKVTLYAKNICINALVNIFCRSSPTWKALKQWEIDVHDSDNDHDCNNNTT